MVEKALFSSDRQDWETPQDLFDTLNKIFEFDVDVCANETNHKCKKYFKESDDALSIPNWNKAVTRPGWRRLMCWMNPPYKRTLQSWIDKIGEQVDRGSAVVALVPARTETKWFQPLWNADALIFVRGRLKFVGAKSSAPFPSVIAVFGRKLKRRERKALNEIGRVIIP